MSSWDYMISYQRKLRDEVWESVRKRLGLPHGAVSPATPAELDQMMVIKKAEEGLDYAEGIHFHDLMGILRTLNALETEQRTSCNS